MRTYGEFFEQVTGHSPFPYQERLGVQAWPDVLDVPTGLGKTAAIVVAWLWKRLSRNAETPRRLAYCLPMRVLVEQTSQATREWIDRARPEFMDAGIECPRAQTLMGGELDSDWRRAPERPTVLVGTQDMLLSRALMRGYGMSRYGWPIDFALLHNDCMWVYDEVQLMGPAVATSAQLDAFRRTAANVGAPCRSLWASATVRPGWLATVDFAPHMQDLRTLGVGDAEGPEAFARLGALKRLSRSRAVLKKLTVAAVAAYADQLASEVLERHRSREQTIVIVNRVDRAQAVYRQLTIQAPETQVLLLHARFRARERRRIEEVVRKRRATAVGRIIVATQAIEAGVDVTSSTLFAELAPWSSMVQRFGRCNRYGEVSGGSEVVWIDTALTGDDANPYLESDVEASRRILEGLQDVGPSSLPAIAQARPSGQVIRLPDFEELFNTDSDLQGFDIDVAPYIRDQGPPQVQVYWRDFDGQAQEQTGPGRDELCPVSMGQIRAYLKKKIRGQRRRVWRWDPLAQVEGQPKGQWVDVRMSDSLVPGSTLLLDSKAGGYDDVVGFDSQSTSSVAEVSTGGSAPEAYRDDRGNDAGSWLSLTEHLTDAAREAAELCSALGLSDESARSVRLAAAWHDVGKAHAAFQTAIADANGCPDADQLWAKAPGAARPQYRVERHDGLVEERRYFRHELASMLAWLEHNQEDVGRDLIAFLIAAHHGKVRMGIRAMPAERHPRDGRPYARGVWEGDELPPIGLNGTTIPATELRLDVMRMGLGPAGPSWIERTSTLLEEGGPFMLAWLESLVRIADWRASAKEGASS